MTTDDLTAAVAALDPDTVAAALAVFVVMNPHFVGAHWDDVIEILFDADAHLDVTEACDTFDEAVAAVTTLYAGLSHGGVQSE